MPVFEKMVICGLGLWGVFPVLILIKIMVQSGVLLLIYSALLPGEFSVVLLKTRAVSFIILLASLFCSGCIWGTAAVVGVAVLGANVNEYQEGQKPRNATQALDEHLEDQQKIDAAISESDKYAPEPVDTEEIINTYSDPVTDN